MNTLAVQNIALYQVNNLLLFTQKS